MRKILSLLAVLVLSTLFASAQVRTVSGLITDAGNLPLPYASVVIKGTTKGTTTDANGNFKIDAQNGDVLVISAVGLKSQEIKVGESNNYSVQLQTRRRLK